MTSRPLFTTVAVAACATIGYAAFAVAQVTPLTSPSEFTAPRAQINFDDRQSETAANTAYSSLGVTFRNIGDAPIPIYNWQELGRLTTSQPNVIATVSSSVGGQSRYSPYLDVIFSSPTTEVGAYFGNDQGPAAIPTIRLSVFDASDQLIGSISATPNGNTSVDQFIGLRSSRPFVRARFENVPDNFYSIVLDDLTFSAAPPPPPVSTLSSILTGVGRPYGMAIHGGFAYIADPQAHTVWKVDLANPGQKTAVAGIGWKTDLDPQDWQGYNGDGIEATEAQLDNPSGVAVDADGNLYIADTGNHAVRKIAAGASFITTVAGIPTSFAVGENTRLFAPRAVAVDQAGNVYIADMMNQQVKKLDKATGSISVVAGVAGRTGRNDGTVAGAEFCPPFEPAGCTAAARLNSPIGVAVDSEAIVYIADEGNNRTRKVTLGGNVSTLLASGLLKPTGIAVTPDGRSAYIADYGNHRVVRADCNSDSCSVTTIAGVGKPGSSVGNPGDPASSVVLNSPMGVTLDGNSLYIADMMNGRVVVINVTPAP